MTIKLKLKEIKEKIETQVGQKFFETRMCKSGYESDTSYIYKTQELAALQIISHMLNGERFIILSARTQSGKSGTFNSIDFIISSYPIINDLLKLKYGNSWLITPMSDVVNLRQLKDDHGEQTGFGKSALRLITPDNILHNPNTKLTEKRLKKINNFNNSLIIVDESHLASFSNSLNDLWLNACGVSKNGNSIDVMIEKNIFYLSVSATPFEELASNEKYGGKIVVELEITEEYHGLEYFIKNKLLRKSFTLKGNEERFCNLVEKEHDIYFKKHNKNGYIFVRIPTKILETDLVPMGWNYMTFYQKDTYNLNNELAIVPEKPTLIFVKNKLLQSYQLKPKNVVLMFDRVGKKSREERTAFMVQSFFGRVSGYDKPDVLIYTDLDNIEGYENFIKYGKIVKTKHTKSITYNNNNDHLILLDFNNDKELFAELLKLEKKDKTDIFKILNKIKDVSRFENHILTTIYDYDNEEMSSYKEYITRGYENIKNRGGYTKTNYMYGIKNYVDGTNLSALVIDEVNHKVIFAHKTKLNISDIKDINILIEIDDESSYHDMHNLSDVEIKPQMNNRFKATGKYNDIKIHLDIDTKELILLKGTKVFNEIEDMDDTELSVKNHKLVRDIKSDKITDLENANRVINIYSKLCFNDESIIFTTTNGQPFIDLIKTLI